MGPGALALRRLRHDRAALGFGLLLVLVVVPLFAAPLYAGQVAATTPDENHLTDQVSIDGERKDVVSLLGTPIGPTWQAHYFLGADETGRDLMVRLLYALRDLTADRVRGGRADHGPGGTAGARRRLLPRPDRHRRSAASSI